MAWELLLMHVHNFPLNVPITVLLMLSITKQAVIGFSTAEHATALWGSCRAEHEVGRAAVYT